MVSAEDELVFTVPSEAMVSDHDNEWLHLCTHHMGHHLPCNYRTESGPSHSKSQPAPWGWGRGLVFENRTHRLKLSLFSRKGGPHQ